MCMIGFSGISRYLFRFSSTSTRGFLTNFTGYFFRNLSKIFFRKPSTNVLRFSIDSSVDSFRNYSRVFFWENLPGISSLQRFYQFFFNISQVKFQKNVNYQRPNFRCIITCWFRDLTSKKKKKPMGQFPIPEIGNLLKFKYVALQLTLNRKLNTISFDHLNSSLPLDWWQWIYGTVSLTMSKSF